MELPQIPATPIPAGHPTLSAFRHRNFRLFFVGQSISLIGTWSQILAVSWLVWRLTHSAAWLGAINFTVQVPMLLFGLPGGWAADRFDRLRALTLMQVLCMLQAILFGGLTLTGRVTLWQVVTLSAILGTVYAFEFPLRLAFVTDMVGRRDLLNAVSLNSAMFHGTRIVGPSIAGFIVAWKGEGICFLFNAATFLFLIAGLLLIRRRELVSVPAESAPLLPSIAEGLRFAWRKGPLRRALVLIGIVTTFGMAYIVLLPVFADQVYGGGSVELGWMMGASGIGALLGALWLAGRRSHERLLSLAAGTSVLFSIAIVAFSHLPTLWSAMPVLAVAGFFLTIHISSINTLLQEDTPDHIRGRMMSVFATVAGGIAPFGFLLAGFVAREIGAPLTMAIFGAVCLIAGTVIWLKARGEERGKRPAAPPS